MNKRELAEVLKLHNEGLDLIPLHGKAPVEKTWLRKARKEWEDLEPILAANGCNVGIRTGRPLAGYNLAVLDVDVVAPLESKEEKELEQAIKNVLGSQNAPEVISGYGHGSRHLYVLTRKGVNTRRLAKAERVVEYTKSGAVKSGPVWTLEIRGRGSQVVGPQSTHPDTGERYKGKVCVQDLPVVDIGGALEEQELEGEGAQALAKLKIPEHYRDLLLEGDCSGYASRSEALFGALVVLARDSGLSDGAIAQLVLHPEVALGAKAREKGDGAARWLLNQVRSARAKVAQVSAPALPSGEDNEPLAELMARNALVLWGGRAAVFRESHSHEPWQPSFEILTVAALKVAYENKAVMVGAKRVNPVDIWLRHPERREYLEGARMVCPPLDCPQGVFNLWRGWAVSPHPRRVKVSELEPWMKYVLEVICAGNQAYASWVHDWLADLFQDPGNHKGVALVLRSGEGTGKGTFCQVLSRIVGQHYRHITQESQLTGKFNAHLADSVLVNANEMVWASDRRGRGALYALVTDKLLMLERKSFDAVPMQNHNHFIVSSNMSWVVPAGVDARRWFVLDVSEEYKQDSSFFTKLLAWAEGEVLGQLLRYYQDRKVRSNLRKAPITEGLVDQKIAGFDSVQVWWHEALERGSVLEPIGDAPPEWAEIVPKQRLYNAYMTHCRDSRVRGVGYVRFFRRLHAILPEDFPKEVRLREGKARLQAIQLPLLEDALADMEQALKG